MTTYTAFGAGAPAGIAYGADTSAYTLATAFKVTSAGLSLTKGRIYLSSNSGAITAANVLSAGDLQFGLFPQTDGAFSAKGAMTPLLTTAVTVSSLTMDAWNEATLVSPYALTNGTVYYASWLLPAGRYSYVAGTFAADLTVGPITCPAGDSQVPGLGLVANGGFVGGGGSLAPVNTGGSTWYGIDVEVSDGGTTQTGTGTLAVTDALTGTGVVTRTAEGALSVAATLAGSGIASTPAATGSWWGLVSIARESARNSEAEPTACPNDGEPLRSGPRGELYCPFDGWRP